jgi:hypothetical protein
VKHGPPAIRRRRDRSAGVTSGVVGALRSDTFAGHAGLVPGDAPPPRAVDADVRVLSLRNHDVLFDRLLCAEACDANIITESRASAATTLLSVFRIGYLLTTLPLANS